MGKEQYLILSEANDKGLFKLDDNNAQYAQLDQVKITFIQSTNILIVYFYCFEKNVLANFQLISSLFSFVIHFHFD